MTKQKCLAEWQFHRESTQLGLLKHKTEDGLSQKDQYPPSAVTRRVREGERLAVTPGFLATQFGGD